METASDNFSTLDNINSDPGQVIEVAWMAEETTVNFRLLCIVASKHFQSHKSLSF